MTMHHLPRHLLMTGATSLAIAAATLISGVVVARTLGPEARGMFGSIVLISQLTVGLASLSVFEAAVIRIRRTGSARDNAARTLVVFAAVATGVAIVALGVGGLVSGLPGSVADDALSVVVIAALIAGGLMTAAFEALEAAGKRLDHLNAGRAVGPILFAFALLISAATGALSLDLALVLLVLTLLPALAVRSVRWRRRLLGDTASTTLRPLVVEGLRLHAAHGTMLLARHADRVILLALWPAAALGQYFVAWSVVAAALAIVCQALHIAATPSFAEASKQDLQRQLPRYLQLSLAAGIANACAIWLAAPLLIPMVFGTAFADAVPLAIGLGFALVPLPAITLICVVARAQNAVWAALLVAAAMLSVFGAGVVANGFAQAAAACIWIGLAYAAGAIVGLGALRHRNLLASFADLVPRLNHLAWPTGTPVQMRGAPR